MSDAPDPVRQARELTYTVTVRNNGPADAQDVVLTGGVTGQVTFVRIEGLTETDDCTATETGDLICTLGDFAQAAERTLTVVVKATKTGTVSATASVEAAAPDDPGRGNNTATEGTAVVKK